MQHYYLVFLACLAIGNILRLHLSTSHSSCTYTERIRQWLRSLALPNRSAGSVPGDRPRRTSSCLEIPHRAPRLCFARLPASPAAAERRAAGAALYRLTVSAGGWAAELGSAAGAALYRLAVSAGGWAAELGSAPGAEEWRRSMLSAATGAARRQSGADAARCGQV